MGIDDLQDIEGASLSQEVTQGGYCLRKCMQVGCTKQLMQSEAETHTLQTLKTFIKLAVLPVDLHGRHCGDNPRELFTSNRELFGSKTSL